MTTAGQDVIAFTSPMECLPVSSLPEGLGWVYELKLDGYRGQAIRDTRGVHLLSRRGKDFSRKYPGVFAALKDALPIGTAVDGELVAFDQTGQLSFNAMPRIRRCASGAPKLEGTQTGCRMRIFGVLPGHCPENVLEKPPDSGTHPAHETLTEDEFLRFLTTCH